MDCSAMFFELDKVEEIIFGENSFHTDLCGSLSIMFCGCKSLTELDLSMFETSNVTNFNEVFEDCTELKSVNLAGFDASAGQEFRLMFSHCESLTELDLTSFSTPKAVTFKEMFLGCTALKKLDIRFLDTVSGGRYSKYFDENCDSVYFRIPANTDEMFSGCKNLEALYVGQRFVLPRNAHGVFYGCDKLDQAPEPVKKAENSSRWQDHMPDASIIGLAFLEKHPEIFGKIKADDIRKVIFTAHLPEADGMAMDISEDKDDSVRACLAPDKKTLTIGAEGGINAAYCCKELFHWMSDIEEIIFEENSFHTDLATDFSFMFNCCNNLIGLDLRGFNTAASTTFEAMFNNCESLEFLDVSSFDTSKARNFSDMFSNCASLEELDVTGFDTSNAKTMFGMFFVCENLTELDVSSFDTSQVTKFTNMFSDCSRLKKLDLSNFDTSSANEFLAMFSNCEELVELDISGFDTTNSLWFEDMFEDCKSLETLIISDKFVIPPRIDLRKVFQGCDKLDKTKYPQIFH